MEYYHFTGEEYHWNTIKSTRYLDTTNSKISSINPFKAPNIVWLTSNKTPEGTGIDRGKIYFQNTFIDAPPIIRITVDVPDAMHWPAWSMKYLIKKSVYDGLAKSANGDPITWYVVDRPIYDNEWVIVENIKSGEVLWKREENYHNDVKSEYPEYLTINGEQDFVLNSSVILDDDNTSLPCRPYHLIRKAIKSDHSNTKLLILNGNDNLNELTYSLMVDVIQVSGYQQWKLLKGKRDEDFNGRSIYLWLNGDDWDIVFYSVGKTIRKNDGCEVKGCKIVVVKPEKHRESVNLRKIISTETCKQIYYKYKMDKNAKVTAITEQGEVLHCLKGDLIRRKK